MIVKYFNINMVRMIYLKKTDESLLKLRQEFRRNWAQIASLIHYKSEIILSTSKNKESKFLYFGFKKEQCL